MKNKIFLSSYEGKRNVGLKINLKNLLASLLVLLTVSLSSTKIHAQSMGISNTSITPDASAILEMRTTSKGLLIPRMTTADRGAISAPANGLIIYNTDTRQFNFYDGTASAWRILFSGSSGVNSVTGIPFRITIGGTPADPTIDIASNYAGQSSITTLGTIVSGIWNGSLINPTYGGTGVNNGEKTLTLGGNLTTSGAFSSTLTSTATTSLTLPTTGTLATLSGTETLTNKTLTSPTITGGISTPEFIDFNLVSTNTPAEGRLKWNSTDKTLDFRAPSGASNFATLQIGQESYVRIVNKTGATIEDGNVVYLSGASGLRATGGLAKADSEVTSRSIIGLTSSDIEADAEGMVTSYGLVRNLNTASYTQGSSVFLSATNAGGLTSTAPPAPHIIVKIGVVVVSHATSGSILVNVESFSSSIAFLKNGETGSLPYQTGPSTTAMLPLGTTNYVLTAGASAPQYVAQSTLTAGNVITNANLTGPIASIGNTTSVSSQTGTGSTFVMNTSPTLVTPNLGTPSAATLTNATQLPLTTGVTGVLPIANGGTNNSILPVTAGGVIYTEGARLVNTGAGLSGDILKSQGAGAPVWLTPGTANGVASLDGSGKILAAQLPSGVQVYKGTWNANTNTPALADGTGTPGDTYGVSVAGTRNLGSGSITFVVGDQIIYNGTVWQLSPGTSGNFVDLSNSQTVAGAKTWSSLGTFNLGITSTGAAVNLNNDATANAVNIGTSTNTGTVTIGGTGTQILAIGNGEGIKTTQLGSNTSTSSTTLFSGTSLGALAINANAGGAVTNIGTGTTTGAVTIGNSANNVTLPRLSTEGIVTNTALGLLGTVAVLPVANGGTGNTTGAATTNANLTGEVTSVGNATTLGSFTSSSLATALTNETGSGAAVFATSPTLITPALGTPASGILTNATGLPISTGVSGLATSVATTLADPSSFNLTSAITDETGTGALVFATSPTLVNPLLGTPASGVATNMTGLPLTTGVIGVLPVTNGGSGQTSYTDGQLLIGNTTGNTLNKATLTGGSGISVTNAGGSITIANTSPSSGGTVTSVTSANSDLTVQTTTTTPVITIASAPKLTTPRTIAGVSFDGTTNIPIPASGLSNGVTGSGAVVLANSPTLITPALGTPSALIGTNITGTATSFTASNVTTNANLTGHVTSTGNSTLLGSFTSANLATALTNETGSGEVVFATSPTLVTPIIGAATGTSLNVSGQLTSTVATGTAPLVVTSTTVVPNLNIGGNAATATTAGTVTTNANLTGAVTSVGNATTVVTNANLTGEVTSVGNAATVPNATVINKVLTGYLSGAGTVVATDNILQAIQKLDGNKETNANLTGPITSVGNATSISNNAVSFAQIQQVNTQTLLGRSTAAVGNVEEITIGPSLVLSGGMLDAVAGGGGTVTSVSVVSANGLAGTVASSSTTPSITLSTTVTGLLKGNGTAISTATSGTDYLIPTGSAAGLTSFPTLNQNTTGNAATVTTNANLTGPITSVGNTTSVALQTGTGTTFVMNTSPVLVTPNIGTPSAGVATNLTGTAAGLTAGNVTTNANLTGAVVSTGNSTALGSFTSANLSGALTDETGTLKAVFSDNPTFTTRITTPVVAITTGAADGYFLRSNASGVGSWVSITASQVYKGTWAANNNTPALANATGTAGWYYRVVTAGTVNFGAGGIAFLVGDDVSYNGTIWERIPAAAITGAALTKTDDANVTVTLGGSPSTSLVNAASITLGWNGILASTRGGTGNGFTKFTGPTTTEKTFTLPDASATLLFSGGALGTPSSGVATNLTGTATGLTAGNVTTNANLTGAVTSVGNAASLGSFTSANLSGALTDETGTGAAVFGTSPTLTTPVINGTITGTMVVPIANGGTGQTTYTDGQLLIGNSTGSTLTKTTLTAGNGITITNAAGAITIANTPTIQQATFTTAITTTSTTYVVATGLTITPGAGDYLVFFSSTSNNSSNGNSNRFSIFSNGVQVAASEVRHIATAGRVVPVHTNAYITGLGAGQAIDVRWNVSAGTGTLGGAATLIVQRVK